MKKYHIAISFCLLFASCSMPPKYMGDRYAPTTQVDVYYSVANVPGRYKVIGHLSSHKYAKGILEKNLEIYAKKVGADAIIISGTNAEVLKYDK